MLGKRKIEFKIPHVKPRQALLVSFLLFALWLALVIGLQKQYILATQSDALAMIHILFPFYWIIVCLQVVTSIFVFSSKDSPRWLHITLLAQFALMLFYTPFLIGGFSWSPDALWHTGVAQYFPSILSGATYSLTQYCQTYPFSFGITYVAETFLQIDTVTYSLYIFPTLCIVLISSLAYFFISRLTDKTTAFLSMLIALPTLHYIEPHVSPFAMGTVLVLASFVLLTYKTVLAYALNLAVIIALVITHPISPIFIGIYITAVLLVALIGKFRSFLDNRNKAIKITQKGYKKTWLMLITLLLFLSVFWVYWTTYEAAPNYIGVETPLSNVLSLEFLRNVFNAVEWTTGGQGFIYPEISQLSLLIYSVFLVSTLLIFVTTASKISRKRKVVNNLDYMRLQLVITAIFSVIMSYLLFSSSGERFLLGRGLVFLLIMSSAGISTYLVSIGNKKLVKIKKAAVLSFILFLVCTFPIVAYSKEAYNTFTAPAQEGLEYLSKMDLSNKTVSMGYDQQLAAYTNLTNGLNLVGFPPNLSVEKPDIIVLRINSFYFISMRYDFSFSNNSFTQLKEYLVHNSTEYTRIFSNTQFEIYQKVNESLSG